tara:strand:+ start:10791 stop:12359 length:1569 start_codon:yes stop_codon:yes gene_type:complete
MITQNLLDSITRNSTENVYLIDKKKYVVNLVFLNPDGSSLQISKNNVRNLNINDNILLPHDMSSISFIDNDNVFQRLKADNKDIEFNPEFKNILKGYNFRGDGRDFLYIEILPVDKENEIFGVNDQEYNKLFGYRNVFICTDSDEYIENGNTIKTYNLMDFDEKILKERKSYFSSSSLVESDKPTFLLSNKEREVETGKCIKNLLRESLLLKANEEIVDTIDGETPDFEDGSSKIFYTSPANNTSYEDLLFLYDKHVSNSTKNDFSILKKDKFTNRYSLKSVNELFDKAYNKKDNTAGKLNLEKILISGSSDEESSIQNSTKSPTQLITFGEYSQVRQVKFFNTDSLINSNKLVTKALHSYNFEDKQFNLDKQDSDISKVRDFYTEDYVQNMKGESDLPFPNFVVNNTKNLNLSFTNDYSLYGENDIIRRGEGLNKLLKHAIFTNIAAEIQLKGQLFRKTGTFLSLDRAGRYVDNLFDSKFLGIYFIIDVNHSFINDTTYNNTVLAVKTYIYDDPKFREDIL